MLISTLKWKRFTALRCIQIQSSLTYTISVRSQKPFEKAVLRGGFFYGVKQSQNYSVIHRFINSLAQYCAETLSIEAYSRALFDRRNRQLVVKLTLAYHLPLFSILAQGSCGANLSPFCKSSTLTLSGLRIKAI